MTDKIEPALLPPFLMVKRFAVRSGSHFVYDQTFNLGLNIIRGDNTTGKSTIVDLMYYALGAELTDWTTEQEKCDETLVEVHFNYRSYCLKREIVESGKSAMYVFEGVLNDSLKDLSKWYRFPNARSESTRSYSQKIFELLSLPAHKTDDSKNLTMHQILRLMYVDQLSETTKLLKEDKKYDNASLRRAIGEYLLGIDNLDAHNIRQDLIEANSRFDKAHAELRAIYKLIGSTDSILREEQINNEIAEIERQINELHQQKKSVRSEKVENLSDDVKRRVKEILASIDAATNELQKLTEQKDALHTEIVDTSLFLHSLDQRLIALEESKLTNAEMGELIFKYCPACLTPIATHDNEGSCGLCKEDLTATHRNFAYLQMSTEIQFQKKESDHLLEGYHDKLSTINGRMPAITRDIEYLKQEYRDYVASIDDAETMLSEIDNAIGYKRGIISSLENKRQMIGEIEKLIAVKEKAQDDINKLEELLAQIEAASKGRVDTVYANIESIAAEILHMDGGYEEVFEEVEDVLFDFQRDKMAINGRSKFSASSMVVMKNAIRIAIYLNCINDKGSRLPRFLLLDNIEDKGMTESRSQNFQRKIVEMCDSLETDYQLIFTTSMIDPDLDKSDYVIGPYYKKGEHTLDFGAQ